VLPTSKLSKQLAALKAGAPTPALGGSASGQGAGTGTGAGAVTASSSLTDSKSLQKLSSSRENLAPWELSVVKMGMSILEDHLVPELKSTTLAHDRTCFAIQDILKELSKHVVRDGGEEQGAGTGTGTGTGSHFTAGSSSLQGSSGTADASEGGKDRVSPSGSSSPSMPEPLRLCLLEGQVLEITEPFWITNYTMRPLERVLEAPIYR
jgi:hypothetical protein